MYVRMLSCCYVAKFRTSHTNVHLIVLMDLQKVETVALAAKRPGWGFGWRSGHELSAERRLSWCARFVRACCDVA